jgi:hypothetical protein
MSNGGALVCGSSSLRRHYPGQVQRSAASGGHLLSPASPSSRERMRFCSDGTPRSALASRRKTRRWLCCRVLGGGNRSPAAHSLRLPSQVVAFLLRKRESGTTIATHPMVHRPWTVPPTWSQPQPRSLDALGRGGRRCRLFGMGVDLAGRGRLRRRCHPAWPAGRRSRRRRRSRPKWSLFGGIGPAHHPAVCI